MPSAMEMRLTPTASDAREDAKLQRRSTVLKFIVFASGIFLTFSAYCAFLFLQSSINIEHGVGAASVTATYATAAVFGVVLTPVVMRVFGTKPSIIVCQISYLSYVLANMLPEAYTLIPAGIVVGMGEATMWPTMVLFSVHYARCYAKHTDNEVDAYESEFIGYFFSVFQLSQVFGNLVSYAILYAGKSPVPSTLNVTLLELMDASNLPKSSNTLDLSICGADDCQDPNITRQILYQYIPASQTTLYLMIGVMGAMVVIAIAIHAIFLREIDPTLEAGYREPMREDMRRNGSGRALASNMHEVKNERPEVNSVAEEKDKKEDLRTVAVSTIKATLRHLVNPRQLLITPFALYNGLLMSFAFAELTRAFASCMLGVDQVGLCMAIFSAASGVVSFFTGRVSKRYGRNMPLICAFLLDIGNYMLCLFWIPTSSSLWVVYVIFFLVGSINGIWQPMVNEMHAAYFSQQQDIAFTVWNLWVLIGIAIQYGWSTSLCVNYKIYIQIGVLCAAVLSYKIGENKRVTKRVDKLYDIVNDNRSEGSTFL